MALRIPNPKSLLWLSTVVTLAMSGAAVAKPLITSSEETLARICLAGQEDLDRLIEACSRALEEPAITVSQKVELLNALANAQSWNGDEDAATATYRRSLDLDETSVDAWNGLGWSLRSARETEKAYEAFSRSVELDVSVQGLAGKASTGRDVGEITPDASRAMLEAAMSIDPSYHWARRDIGWSHFDDGNWSEAIASFEAVLAEDPYDQNAYYGIGRAALGGDMPERALEALNKLLDLAPDDFWGQVYRVAALRNLDRNAQALREAERLIADFPMSNTGYYERGRALVALGRRGEALEAFAEAESILGPDGLVLYWYADTLGKDGQWAKALEVINRAIALEGSDHYDQILKSYIALELKDYPLARSAAEASMADGVEDPWAHYYIAISLVHTGDTPNGLERFDRAMAEGLPKHRVGAFASELISKGKYVEAVQLRVKY
ncbi:MAG: tetratricopeptide repeat protein [Boseongicola sp.]|nr:tetratricopeptide repeat protein [Boseongicola sp.]NNJ68002.1 tetratricopeptide repeat protein [Boseongicola sp.]